MKGQLCHRMLRCVIELLDVHGETKCLTKGSGVSWRQGCAKERWGMSQMFKVCHEEVEVCHESSMHVEQ